MGYDKVAFDAAKDGAGQRSDPVPSTLAPILELIMREIRDIRSDLNEIRNVESSREARRVHEAVVHDKVNTGLATLLQRKYPITPNWLDRLAATELREIILPDKDDDVG